MKKITSLLLVSVFLFALISCGSAAEIEIVPELNFDTDKSVVDMNGYSCVIQQDALPNVEQTPFFYLSDSTFYDMVIDRIRKIEADFNCKISFDDALGLGMNVVGNAKRNIAGGLSPGNMVYCSNCVNNEALAYGELLYPLTELSEYIDLSDFSKYGRPNLYECCMYKGVPYGVVPAALPQLLLEACIQPIGIIDEDNISQYGKTDPRDLYEQKKWTWAEFDRITDDYYTKEGSLEIFSFAGDGETLVCGFIGGSGLRIVQEDNGRPKLSYDDPKMITAVDAARAFIANHKDQISLKGYGIDVISAKTQFITFSLSSNIKEAARVLENFGLVPFPVDGVSTQNGEEANYYATVNTLSIFVNVPEPEYDARILSALLDPIEGYETESELNDLLYKTMFYDQRDVEVYMHLTDRSCFNYGAQAGFLWSTVLSYSGKTGAELAAGYAGMYDYAFEHYVLPNYEYIKSMENGDLQ